MRRVHSHRRFTEDSAFGEVMHQNVGLNVSLRHIAPVPVFCCCVSLSHCVALFVLGSGVRACQGAPSLCVEP